MRLSVKSSHQISACNLFSAKSCPAILVCFVLLSFRPLWPSVCSSLCLSLFVCLSVCLSISIYEAVLIFLIPPCFAVAVLGNVCQYFVKRHSFNPKCHVVAWSGDNPCSLAGLRISSAGWSYQRTLRVVLVCLQQRPSRFS